MVLRQRKIAGMLERLRRHPFGVEAFFRRSLVLTYALPADLLRPRLGPGLVLDTYDDLGFVAIALVQTESLRPKGFPRWLGRDFFLSGTRIFARFERPGQPTLRGLEILRSDTDRRAMVTLGNLFTHYGYHRARVQVDAGDDRLGVRVTTQDGKADLAVDADLSDGAPLPAGSPFRSMKDARHFAGPLPFTFGLDEAAHKMVVVKGLRTTWDPRPVRVVVHTATFFEHAELPAPRLANAFYVADVPYTWKPGTLEDLP